MLLGLARYYTEGPCDVLCQLTCC